MAYTLTCDACGASSVLGSKRRLRLVVGDGDFDCGDPQDFCDRACLLRWHAEDAPQAFRRATGYAAAAELARELHVDPDNEDDCEAGLIVRPAVESIATARAALTREVV